MPEPRGRADQATIPLCSTLSPARQQDPGIDVRCPRAYACVVVAQEWALPELSLSPPSARKPKAHRATAAAFGVVCHTAFAIGVGTMIAAMFFGMSRSLDGGWRARALASPKRRARARQTQPSRPICRRSWTLLRTVARLLAGFHPTCLSESACSLADLALRGVDDLFA
jgi:hypothetical protein